MASQHTPSDYPSFRTAGATPSMTALPTHGTCSALQSRVGDVGQSRLPLMNLARLVELLQEWRDRYRQRRQLATLDQYMLRDIGLSSADVDQELHKPFWRV